MIMKRLLARLMADAELATSRVGVVVADASPLDIRGAAEVVGLDPAKNGETNPACEVVIVDVGRRSLDALPAAAARLTRDGLLIAAVPWEVMSGAVDTVAECGADWVAVLDGDAPDQRFVLAANGSHPAEWESWLADHVVYTTGAIGTPAPQARDDRARRRQVRRQGRERLMAVAERLRERHGDDALRVTKGIEILVGERPHASAPNNGRPALFTLPGLPVEPWPEPARWPRLAELLAAWEQRGPQIRAELVNLVESRTPDAYARHEYMERKFQLEDPTAWKSLQLYDERSGATDLPTGLHATRALLTETASCLSGEAVILRLAPASGLGPHYDDNDYQLTLHVGLSVPPGAGLRVDGVSRTWQEGKPLIFSPAFLHEVWNTSPRPRDILLVDIWHPDLSETEIEALNLVRTELATMREERLALEATA